MYYFTFSNNKFHCTLVCLPHFTHFIPFYFFIFFNFSSPTIHPIFFSTIFQLSKSLYNIFKSQPFIPLWNSQSQTILDYFSKSFSNYFFIPKNRMEWAKCPPKQGKSLSYFVLSHSLEYIQKKKKTLIGHLG